MLALISGRGALPALVAQSQQTQPLVCVLEGFDPDGLQADIHFRLEQLGTFLATLSEKGVTEVCFCGAIERPVLDPSALDAATLPLVPIIMKAIGSGDDGALRAVIEIFETKGFTVRAAHDLAPDLLAPEGVLSVSAPDKAMTSDVSRADAVLDALAPLDVGQGCVVGAGQVWGLETLGGTDHMLATLPEGARKAGSVLVKHPKKNQDRRVDLPSVGPLTIIALQEAGLKGLVIEAGAVLLLDAEQTIAQADAAGLVLWSRKKA